MLEILAFIFLGILLGVILGLIPGIHPNMIVIFVPLISALVLNPFYIIAFIVSLSITNVFVDFIPSILLGAPDEGTEMSVLPGHILLNQGFGYEAIKLAVTGGVGAIIMLIILLPLLLFSLPALYSVISPFIFVLLIFVVVYMLLSEKGNKKLIALFCFGSAGLIGIFMNGLGVNSIIILFPVFSGFFGVSSLILQLRSRANLPEQRSVEFDISNKTINRSVILGSLGGIFSGFLPGIGTSQISALASVDKNPKSFLITTGAISVSNMFLSFLTIWLIDRARSGAAVIISNLFDINVREFSLIIFISIMSAAFAVVITLILAKKFVSIIHKINYNRLSLCIIILITLIVAVFSGLAGLLLLTTCTSLGIFASLSGIKRAHLMGVLLVPTILFFTSLSLI